MAGPIDTKLNESAKGKSPGAGEISDAEVLTKLRSADCSVLIVTNEYATELGSHVDAVAEDWENFDRAASHDLRSRRINQLKNEGAKNNKGKDKRSFAPTAVDIDQFFRVINQNKATLLQEEYENIPPMLDEIDNTETAIYELANALEIPEDSWEAFREIVIAFKEGGTRLVRNVSQTRERHAKKPPRYKKQPSEVTFREMETVDFENADPSDTSLVRAAQRFTSAYRQLTKKDPAFETPDRKARVLAAYRLVTAHNRAKAPAT